MLEKLRGVIYIRFSLVFLLGEDDVEGTPTKTTVSFLGGYDSSSFEWCFLNLEGDPNNCAKQLVPSKTHFAVLYLYTFSSIDKWNDFPKTSNSWRDGTKT